MYDAQLVSTGLLWALTTVAMMAVWNRLASVALLPVVLVSVLVIGLQMATDCLHDTTQDFTHDDRIIGVSLHTIELGVLLFVCMAEALYGHMASLPLSELEEPLFDKTEKEKAKEQEKRASKKRGAPSGTTRAQRTARAFRYVWPDSRPLQLRLVACFGLVLAERCVNLAVPVLYKHMVDTLSSAGPPPELPPSLASAASAAPGVVAPAAAAGAGAGRLTQPLGEAVATLLSAAMAAASSSAGSDSNGLAANGTTLAAGGAEDVHGGLLAAAYGVIAAAQSVSFWSVFYPWVFAYLGFYLLRGASGMEGLLANMRDLVWIPITQAAYRRISLDVFGHLLDLDHQFHLHRKTGQIMRILDRGTSSIQDTVSIVLFNVIPQLIDIVVACTYLALRMQPWAAVIVFITVASYVPLTVIITERRGVIRKRMNALDNAREGRATDMLLNYETVKYFCNERFELDGYDAATRQYQAAEYWQMAFLAMLSITQASVVWMGLAAGMVVAVRGVVSRSLTVGDAVLFITMMNQLYVPLTFFGSYYRQVQKALIDMENMFELLDTDPSVRDPPGAGTLVVRSGRVDFDNVVFMYTPNAPPVLKGVTFTVPGGKTLAVVGATGSGKSTILRLLLRFYDPVSGRVLVDGQDIKLVSQHSLRRAVAVVPQDTVMFNDTVRYNIRYGRTDATDAEVEEAAAVAHIHASIVSSFKKGYATRVGERGLRLSGGEKQRVAFARAVLKRPSLLVLDEATSALDSLTELAIQSSLQTLRTRCTTVIVAHRLSTIMDADMILVLHHGEVAQLGSHSELMEEGGLYAAMWARQQDTAGYATPLIVSQSLATGGGSTSIRGVSDPSGGSPLLLGGADRVGGSAAAATAAAAAASSAVTAPGALVTSPPCSSLPPHPRTHRVAFAPQLPPRSGGGTGGGAAAGGSGGGTGMPRVPSRLMRRAFLSDELSESGEVVDVSRNPTPKRNRGIVVEDEADERLYEDREAEDAVDTPGLASPDVPSKAANGREAAGDAGAGRSGDDRGASGSVAGGSGGTAEGGAGLAAKLNGPGGVSGGRGGGRGVSSGSGAPAEAASGASMGAGTGLFADLHVHGAEPGPAPGPARSASGSAHSGAAAAGTPCPVGDGLPSEAAAARLSVQQQQPAVLDSEPESGSTAASSTTGAVAAASRRAAGAGSAFTTASGASAAAAAAAGVLLPPREGFGSPVPPPAPSAGASPKHASPLRLRGRSASAAGSVSSPTASPRQTGSPASATTPTGAASSPGFPAGPLFAALREPNPAARALMAAHEEQERRLQQHRQQFIKAKAEGVGAGAPGAAAQPGRVAGSPAGQKRRDKKATGAAARAAGGPRGGTAVTASPPVPGAATQVDGAAAPLAGVPRVPDPRMPSSPATDGNTGSAGAPASPEVVVPVSRGGGSSGARRRSPDYEPAAAVAGIPIPPDDEV
ncbi:hypothetical protein GPECTOR_96g720 [Gonium pectorale]|uniref:Uncharacterized protein n=1 Tax=Gonium pectorale TaxID=33097 RepID=A0A150G086_GONPE|nr:hypothetical protein GPECTOR_96g720 [Gonium pectorale]|eukprot:KXZ43254.1 hypothetical protein GPECTOR_96g720 [Gonium pectorale]